MAPHQSAQQPLMGSQDVLGPSRNGGPGEEESKDREARVGGEEIAGREGHKGGVKEGEGKSRSRARWKRK